MQQTAKIVGVAVRLRQLIDYFRVKSAAGLARRAKMPRQTLETAIRRDAISPEIAATLGDALNIRPEWIIFGSGTMLSQPSMPLATNKTFDENYRKIKELLSQALVDAPSFEDLRLKRSIPDEKRVDSALREVAGELGKTIDTQPQMKDFVFVEKATAKLGAGGGLIPDESHSEEKYAFRLDWLKRISTSPSNVVLMDVEGDSMWPTLQNRNIILIDRGRAEFRGGKIFAIGIGDVIQVKRLDIVQAGKIRVISDNAAIYPIFDIPEEDLRIIGQVIWAARTFI